MRRTSIVVLAALTVVGVYLFAQDVAEEMPDDHQSTLTPEEYQNGAKREADTMTRMEPRLTRELAALDLELGAPVFVRIFKETRQMEIFLQKKETKKYVYYKTWDIAAMSGNLGPKLAEGDRQSPEGFYFVPPRMMKPDSRFHLAYNIGFPNDYDRSHGRTGSFIMVHGNEVSIGCFAMTDNSMEEIYTLCRAAQINGQEFFRVHSFPFRMTPERMAAAADHQWYDFWQNLKEGYDYFEKNKT
ncbi:MAG: L,D-transpeptidase family protein, partial [Akkermansiaceae bacterium]